MTVTTIKKIVYVAATCLFLLLCSYAFADPRYADARYCGVENIKRNAVGKIIRSGKVLDDFQKIWPCPSTGQKIGACPGWALDHPLPLKCGGCDTIINISWVPEITKSGPGQFPKDRWERKVYCTPQVLVPMPLEAFPLMISPLKTAP